MQFLRVYQIYYEPQQLAGLDYIPYFNEDCTPFFENSVIRTLVEGGATEGAEYFAVVSWKLRQKIGIGRQWRGLIANKSDQEFTPELFAHLLGVHMPQVMSFQRHQPHDPVGYANQFHPKFSTHFAHIMHRIGIDYYPCTVQAIYCNFFAAQSWLYKKYVSEMLGPAMDVMAEMPELWEDARYGPLPQSLAKRWGAKHYPYHAFVCERMISYFCHIHKYKVIHF